MSSITFPLSPVNGQEYTSLVNGISYRYSSSDNAWSVIDRLGQANLYPDIRPSLNLDFINSKTLDSRITFSRLSQGTYTDKDGVLKTAGLDTPRFDHDPVTRLCKGLLIEEQRTNLALYSEDLSNSLWGGTGSGGVSRTANEIIGDTSNGVHQIAQSITVTAAPHSLSFLVKANGQDYVTAILYDSAERAKLYVNLQTGASSLASGLFSRVIPYGDGWYKVVLTGTFTGVSGRIYIGLANGITSGSESYQGNGLGRIYVKNVQLELGTFHSSYIMTSSAQVTRLPDVVTISGSKFNSFYNLNEGTWIGEATVFTPYSSTVISTNVTALDIWNTDDTLDGFRKLYATHEGVGDYSDSVTFGGQWLRKILYYPVKLSFSEREALVDGVGASKVSLLIRTTTANESFTISCQNSGTFNAIIEWGDGTANSTITSWNDVDLSHTYAKIGDRKVTITGSFGNFYFNATGTSKNKILAILEGYGNSFTAMIAGFSGCANLRYVSPDVNLTNVTNLTNVFRDCPNLRSFPLLNTANVTNITSICLGNSNLRSFPLLNTANVTNIAAMFQSCSNLRSFPLLNTSNSTSFASFCSSCSNLRSFPLLNTSNSISLASLCVNCSNLTSFPQLNTANVTNVVSAWYTCSNLTSFPQLNTANVTNVVSAWQGCSNLTSFPILNVSNATNLYQAWYLCSNLQTFPPTFFDSWTATPATNCLINTWSGTGKLTQKSVENIVTSLVTSGRSAPASGKDITITYDNANTGPLSDITHNALYTLADGYGWIPKINGVTYDKAYYFSQVQALFANGELGGYWSNELTNFFEDSSGVTPASLDGVIGLWKNALATPVIGSNLIVNGTFDNDTTWTTGTGWSIASGTASKTAGTASSLSQNITIASGTVYAVAYTITRTAGTVIPRFTGGTTVDGTSKNASGTYLDILGGVTGNTTLEFYGDASFAGTIDSVVVFSIAGSPAIQTTTANKPYLRRTPTTNLYWADANTATSALTATFGSSLGAACTVAHVGPEGVTWLENQTISTTYNIAPAYGWNGDVLVINRALTAGEKAVVTRYMARKQPQLGPELVTNGTFDTDVSGWEASPGQDISWSDGAMRVVGSTATFGQVFQDIQTSVNTGEQFLYSVQMISSSGNTLFAGAYGNNLGTRQLFPYIGNGGVGIHRRVGYYGSVASSFVRMFFGNSNSAITTRVYDNVTLRRIL